MSPESSPIAAVLDRYGSSYRPQQIEPPPAGFGFSEAVIRKVRCEAGEFCLRGWPPHSLPAARVRGLHHLLRHVREAGVKQVAVPVPSAEEGTLISLDGRLWQLEPWLPGRADFHERPTAERLKAAMAVLAAWHRAAAMFRPQESEIPWFALHPAASSPAVTERLERVCSWLEGKLARLRREAEDGTRDFPFLVSSQRTLDLFERTAPRIARELKSMSLQQFALQPCLRDVWHDHLLFTGDEVTGLIDASACRSENVATDLSRLLGSLVGDDRERWQFALAAYERHRPLSPEEHALVGVLDRSSVLLSGLTWLDRIYLEDRRFDDPQRVRDRMQTILSRLERLADA